jgi:hypothetical protein
MRIATKFRRGAADPRLYDYVRTITGTKAEDRIKHADTFAIRIDLPSEAPCEGIGGLSKTKDVAFVAASPASAVTTIIRKAEAAREAAKSVAGRARRRLARTFVELRPRHDACTAASAGRRYFRSGK